MNPLTHHLSAGVFDDTLCKLYGTDRLSQARTRCEALLSAFADAFQTAPQAIFSAPGRTELGGNHTDHQNGRVLAAAVDLDLLAAVAVNDLGLIRLLTPGLPLVTVDLADLAPNPEERRTSAALVRGVTARMNHLGCSMGCAGMDIYVLSDVPVGSGLSSSAAFEILIGTILNDLFWNGRATPMELAQVGQYAENHFFGKPCGLMDQMASALGGVVAIDFADNTSPKVTRLSLDLAASNYTLCILDSGASHTDLTDEYAAVTDELSVISRFFHQKALRDVPEADFMASLPLLRASVGDRAILRAMHVYGENRRVTDQLRALEHGNFEAFLALVQASGNSSAMYLQNVIPSGSTHRQELMLTIALCQRILDGNGAVRVHGGGFGGTVQAFVPTSLLPHFQTEVEAVLGRGACRTVRIRSTGGLRLA